MNWRMRLEHFKTRLFGLSDESVEFRNKWRGRLGIGCVVRLEHFQHGRHAHRQRPEKLE